MRFGIIIGRFQGLHQKHVNNLFIPAINECDYILIFVGSSQEERTRKNPFTFLERSSMIKDATNLEKYMFVALDDKDNDEEWTKQIRSIIKIYNEILYPFQENEFILYGTLKDASSYYLNLFPELTSRVCQGTGSEIGATQIREAWYNNQLDTVRDLIPETTYEFLMSEKGQTIKQEILGTK